MLKKILLILLLFFFWSCSDFKQEPSAQNEPHRPRELSKSSTTLSPKEKNRISLSEKDQIQSKNHPGKLVKKKTRVIYSQPQISPQVPSKPYTDSLFLNKLKQLKLEDAEIDLSEPLSRSFLFSGPGELKKAEFITLSRERFLKINFDNDILDNTDRYYTNGIRIDIISPFLKPFPLNYLMIPYWGKGVNYYGISIVQNMYTPSTTKIGGILYGDRPYAAYLYLGTFKISNDPTKRFRQSTELNIGIIGPSSYGGFIQKSFHAAVPTNNEPLGWLYQIQNDLVLNYNLCYEKGIVSGKYIELNLTGKSAIGTLYTNFGGGLMVRSGLFNPYFVNLGISRSQSNHQKSLRNMQVYFFLDIEGKVVGYDATLEGGMFNHRSVYTLRNQDISRFVFDGCLGVTLNLGGFRFDIGQYILSPEFYHGLWHYWVHTGLTFTM